MKDSKPFYPPSGGSLFEMLARSSRKPGTKRDGGDFSHEEKSRVWHKGQQVPGYDPLRVRKDCCGAWMEWAKYGDRDSPNGWEVDHIMPVAAGGSDDPTNLQPLNWRNNVQKSDKLNWRCGL